MKSVRLALGSSIVLCVSIWLAGCDRQADRPARAGVGGAAAPRTEEGDGSAGTLENEVKQLSRRLRDLEYPELRERDPREIGILQVRVDASERTFKEMGAKLQVGSADYMEWAVAGYNFSVARADLAWAKQNVHDAVERLAEAADFAEERIDAAEKKMQAGLVEYTLVEVLEAQAGLASAELALIRAEKVAAVANVDISDIELDPDKRARKKVSLPREAVPALPGESGLPFPGELEPMPEEPLPSFPPPKKPNAADSTRNHNPHPRKTRI